MTNQDKIFTAYLVFTQGALFAAGAAILLLTMSPCSRTTGVVVSLTAWALLGVSVMVAAVCVVVSVKREERRVMRLTGNAKQILDDSRIEMGEKS